MGNLIELINSNTHDFLAFEEWLLSFSLLNNNRQVFIWSNKCLIICSSVLDIGTISNNFSVGWSGGLWDWLFRLWFLRLSNVNDCLVLGVIFVNHDSDCLVDSFWGFDNNFITSRQCILCLFNFINLFCINCFLNKLYNILHNWLSSLFRFNYDNWSLNWSWCFWFCLLLNIIYYCSLLHRIKVQTHCGWHFGFFIFIGNSIVIYSGGCWIWYDFISDWGFILDKWEFFLQLAYYFCNMYILLFDLLKTVCNNFNIAFWSPVFLKIDFWNCFWKWCLLLNKSFLGLSIVLWYNSLSFSCLFIFINKSEYLHWSSIFNLSGNWNNILKDWLLFYYFLCHFLEYLIYFNNLIKCCLWNLGGWCLW